MLAITAVVAYAALSDLLSRPKPTGLEFAHGDTGEAEVLGATLKEGRGIYMWLRLPGLDQPRYYALPAPKMPDKPAGDYQDYRHPSLHI